MYIGPFESENEAVNAMSYVGTRLFRFLVLMRKPSQDATRRVYGFVPLQDFSEPWSDEKLRSKYGITDTEWGFVEQMIRSVDVGETSNNG